LIFRRVILKCAIGVGMSGPNTRCVCLAKRKPMETPQRRKTVARFWRAPDLGAELLKAQFADFSYDLHTHDTACLALITSGAIRIRMRGGEFIAQSGDLYAIDPDTPHAGWRADPQGWSQRTIYVDLALLRARFTDRPRAEMPSLRGPVIRDRRLVADFLRLHAGSEAGGSQLVRDEGCLRFARRLFGRHVGRIEASPLAGRESAAVRKALHYIDQHLDDRVGLSDIADAANLPVFRLYRAFERETGMTPHAYQRQARIRAALPLLRRGEDLAIVAALTGFADQAHFTRHFRSRMGVSPGAYRAAILAKY
jgi:AraC-like DNA-binding protein